MKREFGTPVTFDGCVGFVHDGGGTTGVVMLPAWGFEEMTIRRGWAGFADRLAQAGYCCLRFDWPGAGDSLGNTSDGISLNDWLDAVRTAAELLRGHYGVTKIVLLGHGIGGLIAPHCALSTSASAVVQMAPQSQGRAGMRELEILGRMIGSFLGLPGNPSKETIEIGGHSMSAALAKEISELRIVEGSQLGSEIPLLAVLRSGAPGAAEWPQRLSSAGFVVSTEIYAGADGFLSYSQASVPPVACFDQVRSWLVATMPPGNRAAAAQPQPVIQALQGDGYSEKPLLFGADGRLFGILCLPEAQAPRATILLINSGDNYHIGWARMHVDFARALAARGISSFRIDTGGIGDAASIEGHAYYVEAQALDVMEAVTTVEAMRLGPILVSGRCSGGYAAVQTAVADPRVRGLVAVNTVRLGLSPDETFEDILKGGTSSVADYRRRAFSFQTIMDILSGRKSLRLLAAKAAHLVKTQLSARFPRLFGALDGSSTLTQEIRRQARELQARDVSVFLVYGENDGGLDELVRHFGKRDAAAYGHATVRIVSNAEHNMTAPHARQAILEALIDAVVAVEGLGQPGAVSAS